MDNFKIFSKVVSQNPTGVQCALYSTSIGKFPSHIWRALGIERMQ